MSCQDILSWVRRHAAPTAQLCLDSREVRSGDVFFACPGRQSDGRRHVQDALDRGAAAIVAEAGELSLPDGAALLQVPNLRDQLGAVAHEWYGRPSDAVTVVAITGTNGKTSCVQWLAAALNAEGVACGTIGTLGVRLPDGASLGDALTTPDVLTMHRSLAAQRDAGASVVALEASSIGLDQGRLDSVSIRIAGFTNLTRDHLDYHGSVEHYRAAKFSLFDWPGLQAAVINADDEAGRQLLAAVPPAKALAYSTSQPDVGLHAHDVHPGPDGLIFQLVAPEGSVQVLSRVLAEHNVSNMLLVAGVLRRMGWSLPRIGAALAGLRPVDGRLQIVAEPAHGQASRVPLAVVDYAHTPDALERALEALREVAASRGGRLVCVFGCGGNRDAGKRPMMGRIAATLADRVVLTNDNPRDESPLEIIREIQAGIEDCEPASSMELEIEPDRALAILSALWRASPADVVLIAGKGHETYQEAAGVRQAFDDREWARLALAWTNCQELSTDSRRIAPGQLFLALKGEHFDGHAYLSQVQAAGACAAIVERRDESAALPQFAVGDTRQALIRMATAWRRLFDIPVIAVTGSNGKTTTKEMIAAVLAAWQGEAFRLATAGNFNNDIGVPLSILRLRPSHRAAVFELGMNHPGEIALLRDIAQPTIALVNNAQREHQEFMHSVEAVAQENGSVLAGLPEGGIAVFPGDEEFAPLWTELAAGRRSLTFGRDPACGVYADQVRAEAGGTRCTLYTPVGHAPLALSVPGEHNVRNALAAAACGIAAGASLDAVVRGLEAFSPVAGRMHTKVLPDGRHLIDDTYNANPDSVRAAIDVLSALPGPTVLVLGDMGEVGSNGPAMHAEVGAYAKERGIDLLLGFGPASARAVQAFGTQAQAFDAIEPLVQRLVAALPANVLVKGSRSMRMERVVQALEERFMNHEDKVRHAS